MKFHLLLLISLFPLLSSAQHDTICPAQPSISIGGSIQYGFLWSHRYNMGHLVQKHLTSFELDLSKNSTGERCWENCYHYPRTGIAVHVIPLGNPQELGTAIGVYPFFNFPLGKRYRKIKTNMRFGYGLGYITNPFDPIENHKNVAIGSHLNCCMSLRLNEMWYINDKNFMELGLGMTHFSNGASKLPNLGLNIPFVNIGFHHSIYTVLCTKHTTAYTDKLAHTKDVVENFHWKIVVVLNSGFNDIDPPGGNRYALLNLHSAIMKRTAIKHRWGGGIDIMYSDAIRAKLGRNDIHVTAFGNLQPGAKVCYEFNVGRLSFPIEWGAYLYTRYKEFGPVYSRYAVHYLVNDHLLFNVSIKTHFARAEYFEYGIGWQF